MSKQRWSETAGGIPSYDQKTEKLTSIKWTSIKFWAYGRNLVEIDPTSLPHLSTQLRDLNNNKQIEKTEIQNFEKL